MRLDDPAFVREQYASEDGLRARASVYGNDGPDARQILLDRLRTRAHRNVLDAGCGWGELAERIRRELGSDVIAVDLSPRMVELARSRDVDACVADVQSLPFDDGTFDAVVAAWMLYHVPDLDRGLAEIARVLRRDGTLLAITNGQRHLAELWELVGRDLGARRSSFRSEDAAEALGEHFSRVERIDVEGPVTFADANAVRRYIESSTSWREYVAAVPELAEPLVATKRNCVLVASK